MQDAPCTAPPRPGMMRGGAGSGITAMNTQVFNAPGLSLAAVIILMVPMLYFAFASLTFFLRPLADPIVGRMLRGLINTWLLAVAGLGALAVIAFMAAGQPRVAAGLSLLAACALAARFWAVPRIDAVLRAPGDGAAAALRRLQVAGIAYNLAELSIMLGSIPRIFPAA